MDGQNAYQVQWRVDTRERRLTGPDGGAIRLGSLHLYSLIAYLAYQRQTGSTEAGWVQVRDIARLPGWQQHSEESIGKELQRYLRSGVHYPIEYGRITRGPYRFDALPGEIAFDVGLEQVEEFLGIAPLLLPSDADRDAAQSPLVMRFVRGLALAEGTRLQGWSRSEYLDAVEELRGLSQEVSLPRSLRFLALDRILNMELYSSHPSDLQASLAGAQQLASEEGAALSSWMVDRIAVHRVRLLLRMGQFGDGDLGASRALRTLQKGGIAGDTRTAADLFNSAGIARPRLCDGNHDIALQALGLLYHSLELRLLALSWDEVHDSCLNLSLCCANDLGDVRQGLRWMAVADAVREACSVGAGSGLPEFAVVSMLRRFPGEGTLLKSKNIAAFLREIGMVLDERTTVEQFMEERLASGFKRSQDFDDERGLLVGYRTRASLRWQQKRPREAFEDVVRFVHTARKLDEDLGLHERQLPRGNWEQPLRLFSEWARALRLKGRSIEGVPQESFASYLEELEQWLHRKGEP